MRSLLFNVKSSLSDLVRKTTTYYKCGDTLAFWTKYGMVFFKNNESPIYLVHNNTTAFRINPGSLDSKLYMNTKGKRVPKDWALSLMEMLMGILLRSIVPDEHQPKISKLKDVSERVFKEVLKNKEEEWQICSIGMV